MCKQLMFSLVLLVTASFSILANAELVIGCFDSNRAGTFSPSSGSVMNSFRNNITAICPTATFKSTNVLTSDFLSSVNLLVISSVYGYTTEITPLSAAEQTALTNFVTSGGSALIFCDNDGQFRPASQSLVQPFGFDCTGELGGQVAATVVNLSHPVANGPFGAVTNYIIAGYPGWFDILGKNAVAIATLNPNSQISLAAIAPGLLANTSGGVVFFSDSTIDDNSFTSTFGTTTLVDNAIDFVLPPSLVVLPALSITLTNNSSVLLDWNTNFTGFRLQEATNLVSSDWLDQTLSGFNEAVVVVSNSPAFFRLLKP